jgi:hypothetical protein
MVQRDGTNTSDRVDEEEAKMRHTCRHSEIYAMHEPQPYATMSSYAIAIRIATEHSAACAMQRRRGLGFARGICLDLPGSVWIRLDLSGSFWIWLVLAGSAWIRLDSSESVWICLDLSVWIWLHRL